MDTDRLEEAREELFNVIEADEMRNVPVIVFANKQDLPGSASTSFVADKIGLSQVKDRPWAIQGSCAVTGDGIYEGLEQLVEMIKKQRSQGLLH